MINDTWKKTNGLVICLFGQMEVWYRGQPITKSFSKHALKLLALFLLNHDKPLLRGDLAEMLWPEDPTVTGDPRVLQENRQVNFRAQLRKLRVALGEEAHRIEPAQERGRDTLRFDISQVLVDVFLFRDLIMQSSYGLQVRRLEEAIQYYRNHLLFDLTDDWIEAPRDKLKDEYYTAVIEFAGQAMKDGAHTRAEEWLRTALRLDPLEERIVRELITLLGNMSRTNDMDAVYDDLCYTLQEFGPDIKPHPQTQKHYRDLRTTTVAATATLQSPVPTASTVTSPFHIPAPIRELVGQEIFCRELIASLRIGRLVTITGPGGMGKTRIALEIAPRVVSEFRDGVAFVDLSYARRTASSRDLSQIIIQSLGVPNGADEDPEVGLCAFLENKKLLLILDNCEHILPAVTSLLKDLLPRQRNLHVLATSREPVRLTGALVRRIPPLSFPSAAEVPTPATLETSDAARLFLQRVSRSPFVITSEVAADIAWICRTLEGIPLAIEIAAAALDEFATTRQLTESMQRSLWFLKGADIAEPDHSRTLESTIRWSYDLLLSEEKEFLRSISVLTGGGVLDCLKKLSGYENALVFLRNLEARSLLVSHVPPSLATDLSAYRFYLLEPVRQFAADRLAETEQQSQIFQRHAAWFTQLVETMTPHLRGPSQTTSLNRLEGEQSNLDTALWWSLREDALPEEREMGLRLVSHLWPLWMIRGGQATGKSWMDQALLHREDAPIDVRIRLLQGGGNLAIFQDELDHAQTYFMAAEALARPIPDQAAVAAALGGLASVARSRSDLDRAKALLLECLGIFQELQDDSRIAGALGNLANVASDKGEIYEAARYHKEAGDLFRRLEDMHGLILSLNNLAYAYLQIENLNGAAETLQEAFQRGQQTNNRRGLVHSFTLAITLMQKRNQYEEAAVCMGKHENMRERYQLPLAQRISGQYQDEKELSCQLLGDTVFRYHFQRGSGLSETAAVDFVLSLLT